ncbi:MAG: hypothetical protein Q8P92_01745 [Candidatus Daviesbacteria bacterium]|nr:hypothetical protein [Candidatus Daviesbacteria bacterium]
MKHIPKIDKFFLSLNLFLISIHILFLALLIKTLYPIHFMEENLFFFDLLSKPLHIPYWLIIICTNINILSLSFIGKLIWGSREWVILPALYVLNPWTPYLASLNSFYIYLASLILIMILGFIFIKSTNHWIGAVISIFAGVLLLYSSLIIFIIFPLMVIGIIILRLFSKNEIKKLSFWIILFCVPLFMAIFKNSVGWENIYRNEVTILSEEGFLNDVNKFQGQAQKRGFRLLSKVAENRYVYFAKYASLKIIKNLTPATYFTPQEKLASFSFSPPIFLGFILPFLFGLYSLLKSTQSAKFLGLSLILIIPSLLSKQIVDLNRLVIFSPIIFYAISYGLINLYRSKKFSFRIILFLTIILVFIQMFVTISDIYLRETIRFDKTSGINFEIK